MIKKIIFLATVFLVGISVWYSPVIFKGRAPYRMTELMPIAKNLHKTGFFRLESDKNVYLASSLLKNQGHTAIAGNKLTAYLYAWIFKLFGLLDQNQLVLFSVIINSLTLVVFAAAVYAIFGFKTSALFSVIYTLLPFNWLSVYSLGTYEFATLFFSIFTLLFVWGIAKKKEIIFAPLSAVFLFLAAMSKETFFLVIPAVLVYFLLEKKKKPIIAFLVPIVILTSVFYAPSFFSKDGGNTYLNLFSSSKAGKERFVDYSFYGHLYPDPYIYHFERKEFMDGYKKETGKSGIIESLQRKKVIANMGEGGVGFFGRILLGIVLLTTHLSKFISLEEVGETFSAFFVFLGIWSLKERSRQFYKFFLVWLGTTLFLLSFAALVSRSHLKDFGWMLPVLISLGVVFAVRTFREKFNFSPLKTRMFGIGIVLVLVYGFFVSDHILLSRQYDKAKAQKMEAYAEAIGKAEVKDDEVIALAFDSKDQILINYLVDKSTVVIGQESFKKIIDQKKTKEILGFFGIKYFIGYDDDLSKKISANSSAVNIASSTLKISEETVSPAKSFLLNLIK